MKCRKARKFLTEYFYDRPDDRRLRFLQTHFHSCPDCRQARDRFEATLELINRKENLPLNETFYQEFQAKLEQKIAGEDTLTTLRRRSFRQVYYAIREKLSLDNFRLLPSPTPAKSMFAAALFLIVIGGSIYLSRDFSNNKTGLSAPSQRMASSRLSVDDWGKLSDLVEWEEDLDVMQETLDDEDIDLLLQIETYIGKKSG